MTCVGMVEYCAEQAGLNGGQGFIPDRIEELCSPCVSLAIGGYLFTPQLLYDCATNPSKYFGAKDALTCVIDALAVDFVLTDPLGRHLGYTAASGLINEIPDASYFGGDSDRECLILNPMPGEYSLDLFGSGEDVSAVLRTLSGGDTTFSGNLAVGASQRLVTTVVFEPSNPGDPHPDASQVTVLPDELPSDGRFVGVLEVLLRDGGGSGLEGLAASVVVTQTGTGVVFVGPVTEVGGGLYRASLTGTAKGEVTLAVAVGGTVLSMHPLVIVSMDTAWVQFYEKYHCPIGGDTFSGTATGNPEYAVFIMNTSGQPLHEVKVSLLPAPGEVVERFDCGDTGAWYSLWDANGAAMAGANVEQTNNVWFFANKMQASQTVDTGLTLVRTVPVPVLTNDQEEQQATFTLCLNRALDPSINRIEINPWQESTYGVLVEVLGVQGPEQFSQGGPWRYADPADLVVGQTYTITITYRVTRTGGWAGGSCYFKPRVAITLGHQEAIADQTTEGVILAMPSGAQVALATSQTMNFSGVIQLNHCEVVFDQILDRVGGAQLSEIFLDRGYEQIYGVGRHGVNCEVLGANIAGASLTTPTGKVVQLSCDGGGEWDYELSAADAAGLADFPPGVYTITCQSTDGSAPFATHVDTSDLQTGPAESPVITGPFGCTTDSTPTVTWNGATDPNINLVYVGVESCAEVDDGAGILVLPGVTSLTVPTPLPKGGYEVFVAFANARQGTTAEGVPYSAVRYTGAYSSFNVTPFLLTATLDDAWVYQNTATTTADRHHTVLRLAVSGDVSAPQDYDVQISDRGAAGKVLTTMGANSLQWTIRGGRRGESLAGSVSVDVLVRGEVSSEAAPATVMLTLRPLGDIDGDGAVTAADKLEMNKALNGLATLPGIGLRHLDLTGDGTTVNAEDKLVINQVLNGLLVP